ncbi:MAG: mechanosensitive ion channel domain-containing protein [Pseudomonadota bacterium]
MEQLTESAEISAPTAAELDAAITAIQEGQPRIEALMQDIDLSAAEDWLEVSPIESLAERVADESLDTAERALWQQALDHEQAAAERLRGAMERAALALAGQERLVALREQLETIRSQPGPRPEVDSERTISQIEQDLALVDTRNARLSLEVNQRQQTLSRLETQSRTQAELLDQYRLMGEQELAAAEERANSDPSLVAASRAAMQALQRRIETRILAAQLDARTLPPRIESLRLEIPALELAIRWGSTRLRALRAEFEQRSSAELRQLSAELQQLIEREPDIPQRYPGLLSSVRTQIDEIAHTQQSIMALQSERGQYTRMEVDLERTLLSLRERLEVGELTENQSSVFLEQQRRLRALDGTRFALQEVDAEFAQSRLRNITLREQLNGLPAPAPFTGDDGQAILLKLQRDVLDMRVQTEENHAEQLRQNEIRLRSVVALVDELEQLLRETLLWWPSHSPVGSDWLGRIPSALAAFLDPQSWQEIKSAFIRITFGSPASTLTILSLVLLLVYAGRDTHRHLKSLAEKTRHRFTNNIGVTVKAIGRSLFRALPVPVLLAAMAYRLQQVHDSVPEIEILTAVLFSAAIWWLAGHLLLLMSRQDGVGTVHFEWNPKLVQRLRRNLRWYLPTQFVLIICLALTLGHPDDRVFDVLGRAALVATGVLTMGLAWRLLAPYSPDKGQKKPNRRRQLARVSTVAYAGALVYLALSGYLLTVEELLSRTLDTFVVVGLIWLGYRLATRALILSEMRLLVRRMREERAKAAALETGGAGIEGALDLPEPGLTLGDINLQTRTLLRLLAGGVMVVSLFWVWGEILPALSWLDGVTLWSRTVLVGESEILSRVSLQDVLLALLSGVLFITAAYNLPGLMEILLSRGTSMDAASRYTVSTLLRYTLTVAAVISVFSLFGLRWSELQWMLAALTLGLGFGMQEVVANFVSGLIILFERPVRVGDTISIGEFSGTVMRIRTRATTLLDWDNREVLVPNKMFITERLINWTLSDTITRATVTVGVSYDADVDEVMQALQVAGDGHPLVRKEPAPAVLFLKFADSALHFELRVFISQFRDRLPVISELHCQINRRFRELGIEIAYPQVDLHVRDLPVSTLSVTQSGIIGDTDPVSAR